ncbi:MAG: RagB/SusD family nutrient uptake outer membrane protein [Pigmentiphaga sp.]|nr:RagB/SusD family nutrient uptake outer membrane protein [Pigmentiphaga sp.]
MKSLVKITIYSFFSVLFLLHTSCEGVLDTKLENNYGDDVTWRLPDYALGVLMNAYANIPAQGNNYNGDFLDAATDNAYSNDKSTNLSQYVMGGISSKSNSLDNWTNVYNQFRNIHLFIEKGLGGDVVFLLSDSIRNVRIRERSLGEAYFLRAWWGMELLQRFGGISEDGQALGYPIILRNLTEEDKEDLDVMKRNTYEECVLQIIEDCDSAYQYLPLIYVGSDEELGIKQEGRASGRAALALQSRVALFGASPAYQPQGSYAISQDSIDRKWERVVKLSERAIQSGTLGAYTALNADMYVGSSVQGSTHAEFIFRRWFNNNSMEKTNFPPLFFGSGRTNPSQNLVDAFPAKNGFPITDPRSNYDPQNPYINRDNRFELTIYYNNKMFNADRPLEIYTESNGVKGRDVDGYDLYNTKTGYYLKKFMSPKQDMLYNPATLGAVNDFHQNPLLRRAEVYYNLAEALNELAGPNGTVAESTRTAYAIIKDIRTKNGINSTTYLDEVATDKDEFRKLLMNERRLEFAFENIRFYDLRRCLLPLNESIRGVRITKTSSGFEYQGTDPDAEPIIIETRKLDHEKYYYLPLPYGETIKNPALIQNKGW